jgi:hypothetical protein
MHSNEEKNILYCFLVVLISLLLLFVFSTTLDDATRKALLSEDGPVEIASAVLYFGSSLFQVGSLKSSLPAMR